MSQTLSTSLGLSSKLVTISQIYPQAFPLHTPGEQSGKKTRLAGVWMPALSIGPVTLKQVTSISEPPYLLIM